MGCCRQPSALEAPACTAWEAAWAQAWAAALTLGTPAALGWQGTWGGGLGAALEALEAQAQEEELAWAPLASLLTLQLWALMPRPLWEA